MKLIFAIILSTVFSATLLDASILWMDKVNVNFKPNDPSLSNVIIEKSAQFTITEKGYGWENDPTSSRPITLRFKPIPTGMAWRTTTAININIDLTSNTREFIINSGQTSSPSQGSFYVRYSTNRKFWSSWINVPSNDSSDNKLSYSTRLNIPKVDRTTFNSYQKAYHKLDDVNWSSDMDALARWITEQDKEFFNKNIPIIGWIEVLYEGNISGSRRITEININTGAGMSGIHTRPKNGIYPDHYHSKWRFFSQ